MGIMWNLLKGSVNIDMDEIMKAKEFNIKPCLRINNANFKQKEKFLRTCNE